MLKRLMLMTCVVCAGGCTRSSERASAKRDPIFDAPPVPQEIVDRVLSEPEAVPQSDSPASMVDSAAGQFGSLLGSALEGAANRPPSGPTQQDVVRVLFFTADWCTWCRPAKQQAVPWLTSLGYQVEVVDVTRGQGSHRGLPAPRSLPAWVFLQNGREVYRQEGGYLPQHLQEAVRKAPLKRAAAVGAWFGPTVRIAEAMPLVAGRTLKLGTAATISIPPDLKWTTTQKSGSVVLSFDPSPQVVVHKVLNWRVRLEGVEITPTAITLQIDNLPDVTIRFDWSCPARSAGVELEGNEDLHRASTSRRPRSDRPFVRFIGRTVVFAYRVCAIASFVMVLV